MKIFCGFILVAVLTFESNVGVQGQQSLLRGGLNVCSRTYKYNTYYTITAYRVAYSNYRTCCKKIWGICTRRCTRYRTRTVAYTQNKLKVNTGVSHYCCAGYRRRGNQCPVAVCTPACQNGDCIAPNTCRCRPGFSGKYCRIDNNECQASASPCEQLCRNLRGTYACSCRRGYRKVINNPKDGKCQNIDECASSKRLCSCAVAKSTCKATCKDTIGSYRCQCSSGYQLVSNTICRDVDECKVGGHGCQHRCVNEIGGFRCTCNAGYWLRPDKRSCYDLNECRRTNGGCEHICRNTPGSYRCSCRPGYTLGYDKARCTDINECLTLKPCDGSNGICQNIPGSYRCSCKPGYMLVPGNKCVDVNECEGANTCSQTCHNTQGSYYCSCRKGYSLAKDNKKCGDIDECKADLHDCDQTCINNIGSFRCQCRPGYRLQSDKKTCRAIPCKRLNNPPNGFVRCMGLNYGQKCTYSCNRGFRLIGTKDRTCQLSSRWSGRFARCFPRPCPAIRPPLNGFLELPCIEQYNSTCAVHCKKGFLLSGNNAVKCDIVGNKVGWVNNNVKCNEIKHCQPNPCKNGGSCRLKSTSGYECSCAGTGYTGDNCELGIITMTPYPPLILGKQSDWLIVTARPNKELIITPQAMNGDVVFTPKKLVFRHPRTSWKFRVTPGSSGLIRITYVLSGANKKQFSTIPDSFVYIAAFGASEKISKIPSEKFTTKLCHGKILDRCSNKQPIQLSSSCPWSVSGTDGYQSVNVGELKIPLSLAGITLPEEGLSTWMYRKKGILTVSKELNDVLRNGPKFCADKQSCNGAKYTQAEHRFLIKQNMFLRSHLNTLSAILPPWLSILVRYDYSGFHVNNIQSMVLKSYRMKDLQTCRNLPKHFKPSIYAAQILFAPIILKALSMKVNSESTHPTCIVTDLCNKAVYVSLPTDKVVNLTPHLQALGVRNFALRIHGLGFAAKSSIKQACIEKNGTCIDAKMWLKVSGGFAKENVNISIDGEAFVAPSNLREAAVKRFTNTMQYRYEGAILASLSLAAGGKSIDIKIQDKNVVGYGSFGNQSSESLANEMYGFNFKTNSPVHIMHGTSTVSFHPEKRASKSELSCRVLYGLNGGQVTGVSNKAKLRLMIRRLTRSIPRTTKNLLMSLRRRRSVYSIEYNALTSFNTKATKILQEAKITLADSGSEYGKIDASLATMRNLAVEGNDLASLLAGRVPFLEKVYTTKRSILSRLTFFKLILKQAGGLNAIPSSASVLESYSGLVIKYAGKLCFHALCFSNVAVSVHDVKSPSKLAINASNSLLIYATFLSDQTIAGQFKVAKGATVRAQVSKSRDNYVAELPITVKLFGTEVSASLKIDSKKIGFFIPDFNLIQGLHFDLTVEAKNSKNNNWQSVFFTVSGLSSEGSAMSQQLEKMVKDYITVTANLIKTRHGDASHKVQDLNALLKLWRANLTAKETQLMKAQREHEKLKAQYASSLTNLNVAMTTFRSYRVSEFFKNIEKDLNRLHPFEKCKETCISVPICYICQEPVTVDVNTLACYVVNRKVTTTVSIPLKSSCQLTDYRFTPIYTGTCKRGKAAGPTAALGAIGAGIGGIVGGPVGAVVGGIIGGFLGGLFSACNESYEVYKEVINRQVDCTLQTFKPKTKNWKEAACDNKTENVLSGYGSPKECDCNNNTCVRTQDPICAQDNIRMIEQRRLFVRTKMESAGKYNNSFDKLQDAEIRVDTDFKRFVEGEKKYLFARRDYEKTAAMIKQLELEVTLTNRSLSNFNDNFALERCIAKIGKRRMAKPLMIKSVKFQSNAANREEILMEVKAQRSDLGHVSEKNFLFDLRDVDVSMKRGAVRMAKEIFCFDKLRRRRSVGSNTVKHHNIDGYFMQNSSKLPENTTEAERACLISSTVFSFLMRGFEDLANRMIAVKQRVVAMSKSLKAIASNLPDLRNSESKSQRDLMISLKNQIEDDNQQMTAEGITREWLDAMEIVTGANNLTKCLNFEDCVKESLRQLRELPMMLRTSKNVFTSLIDKAEKLFSDLLSSNSIQSLSTKSKRLQRTVNDIIGASAFCAKPPYVKLNQPEKMEINAGTKLQIRCIASSSLSAIKYSWTRDDVPLLSEDEDVLQMTVDHAKNGKYKCIASNIAGKNSSQETFVIVRDKPRFTVEPSDFQYYSTMPKEKTPHFVCNVTADPPARISWFFKSYEANKASAFAYSKPVLQIVNPVSSDAGFYYCKAENSLGVIQSRKARFDVLKSRLPNQAFTLSYDVPVGRSGAPGKGIYARKLASDGELSKDQHVNVSFEYQSGRELNVLVSVTEKLDKDQDTAKISEIDMLKRVSRSRTGLSAVLQKMVTGLKRNRGRSATAQIEKTIRVGFNGELCSNGYTLHENGFTCVECPAGTFERGGKCLNCSIGTYQGEAGKTSCTQCNANQVTEAVGAVNEHQCISPELKATDVIFALDSSGSIGRSNWRKVKEFVEKYIKEFVTDHNDVRVGVVTFDSLARLRIPLRSYSADQLLQRVRHLSYRGGQTMTYSGLNKAGKEFKRVERDGRKRMLFVMTDGRSTSIRGKSGFSLARRAALHLLLSGIHIVSVGIGNRVDPRELKAIASFPKSENVIRYSNFDQLISASRRISATALKGSCVSQAKDIAVVIEASSNIPKRRWRRLKEFLEELFTKFQVPGYKVGIATFSSEWHSKRAFQEFSSASEISRIVKGLSRQHGDSSTDYKNRVENLYNNFLTEKMSSVSPTKIAIFVTNNPFDRRILKEIRRDYPEEDVHFLSVLMNLKSDKDQNLALGYEYETSFTMAELSGLTRAVKSIDSSKEFCSRGTEKEN